MTKVTVERSNTLTRWHKIGERINARIRELTDNINKLLEVKATTLVDADADLGRAALDFQKAQSLMAKRNKASEALASVKASLARANVMEEAIGEKSISALLAEVEHVKRQIVWTTAMGLDRFPLNRAVAGIERRKAECDDLIMVAKGGGDDWQQVQRLKSAQVHFTPISEGEQAQIKAELSDLFKKQAKLLDLVSDKNSRRISLQLDSEVADDIGL